MGILTVQTQGVINRVQLLSRTSLLKVICNKHGLDGVGGIMCNARSVRFTHFQCASHARLNRSKASLELSPLCTIYRVKPVAFSDQCLVSFSLCTDKARIKLFGCVLCKFTNKLLSDDLFTAATQETSRNFGGGAWRNYAVK